MKTIRAERVLFGSDFSTNSPAGVLACIQNALISEEQKDKILSRNLETLLAKAGWSGWDKPRTWRVFRNTRQRGEAPTTGRPRVRLIREG